MAVYFTFIWLYYSLIYSVLGLFVPAWPSLFASYNSFGSSDGVGISEGRCCRECCAGNSAPGVFPWIAFPLSVLGLVGTGKTSIDLFNAFWDGLSDTQRQELRTLAFDAGIGLVRFSPAFPN